MHLPPFLQKLWNRGVDVGVGVATSVFVAAIGLAGWRIKIWLDLRADERKQRQQHRIGEELAQQSRRAEAHERHRLLIEQREVFASNAERTAKNNTGQQGAQALADLWDSYIGWLKSEGLENLSKNLAMLNTYRLWGAGIRGGSIQHQAFLETARSMAHMIRETELPPDPGIQ